MLINIHQYTCNTIDTCCTCYTSTIKGTGQLWFDKLPTTISIYQSNMQAFFSIQHFNYQRNTSGSSVMHFENASLKHEVITHWITNCSNSWKLHNFMSSEYDKCIQWCSSSTIYYYKLFVAFFISLNSNQLYYFTHIPQKECTTILLFVFLFLLLLFDVIGTCLF